MPADNPLRRRPGRSALRRRSDRLRAWLPVLAGLLAVVAVLLAVPMGQSARREAAEAGAAAQRVLVRVEATTLADAPAPVPVDTPPLASPPADVPARWVTADGVEHTGAIPAPAGLRAGSTTTVWIDRAGRPPPHRSPPAAPRRSGSAGRRRCWC